MQTPGAKMRGAFRRSVPETVIFLSITLFLYVRDGGRFSWHDLGMLAWLVGIFLTVGWSALQIFRWGVRFLLSKTPVRGYTTIFVGIFASVAALIGLFVVTEGYLPVSRDSRREMALVMSIALMSGLLGGAFGSMEAKDKQ